MQRIWKFFYISVGCIALFLCGKAALCVSEYLHYAPRAIADIRSWEVKEIAPSQFAAVAHYTYVIGERSYSSSHFFKHPGYTNRYIAEQHLEDFKKNRWYVFVHTNLPELSTLQHSFPFKQCIHAVLSLGILCYFFWLRRFVVSFDPQ